jgi:phosphoglycolate phosphatase
VARKKPAPDAVRLACERLGVTPRDTLFIGDSQNDVDAARSAGCAIWCVPYGYNEGRPAPACDRIVATLAEAAEVLALA